MESEDNINKLINSLTKTSVMELIFDPRKINELKTHLSRNIKKNEFYDHESIFNEYYEKSLKYNTINEQLLFFSKNIYGKVSDEDFDLCIYKFLRNYEKK
jgi:hypothetical protein